MYNVFLRNLKGNSYYKFIIEQSNFKTVLSVTTIVEAIHNL